MCLFSADLCGFLKLICNNSLLHTGEGGGERAKHNLLRMKIFRDDQDLSPRRLTD